MSATAYDRHVRRHWAGQAEAYQRSFAKLCGFMVPPLLDAARVGAGSRVLDVGTGPGTAAAEAGFRGAAVVAVDAEPSMLRAARRTAPRARLCHAVLPELPFADASFDAVVANFVLNHVGQPALALRQLRRVCRPGGWLAVTVWPDPRPVLQSLWGEAFEAAGGRYPDDTPAVDAAQDFARSPEGLGRLFRDVGLPEVRCATLRWTHHADADAWWSGPASGIGSLGRLLADQPPEMVERVRCEYDRLTARYRAPDGTLALPTAAVLASAPVAAG